MKIMLPRRLFALSTSLFLTFTSLMAQTDLPTIVPPSPEASSLAKFNEVPVSHFTGLPNISIPLTSFEVGGRTFPVGLSYHARGIKVAEFASRVGIGWALNAGGAISRQVRGGADDASPYGYLKSSNSLITKLATGEWFNDHDSRTSFTSLTVKVQESTDKLPDVFNLQVGGALSAKFIFDYTDGQPVIQKFDDVDIAYSLDNDGRIESFTIKDAKGYIYYFGKSKDGLRTAQNWDKNMANYVFSHQTGQYNQTGPGVFFKTYNTWQLMDIESPTGDVASFFYEEEMSIFYRRSHDVKEKNDHPIYPNQIVNYASKIESYQYQLKKVAFKGGEIRFNESLATPREDLNGGHLLEKVGKFDLNGSPIKEYQLNHFYTTSPNDNNQLSYLEGFEEEASKRLFLESIVEVVGEEQSSPYIFEYNSTTLPNRFSNSQDAWGYYNGADNGPFLTFFNYSNYGNNRRVNTSYAEAGMLKKITYPTGGYTAFGYEHNKTRIPNEMQDLLTPLLNPTMSEQNGLGPLEWQDTWNGHEFSKTITLGNVVNGLNVGIWIDIPPDCEFETQPCECGEDVYIPGCPFIFLWENVETGAVGHLFKGNENLGNQPPGDYILTVIPQDSHYDPNPANYGGEIFPYGSFNVTMHWEEEVDSDIMYAAGKRIKKIEYSANGEDVDYTREYSYDLPDGTTSGRLFGLPHFYSISQQLGPFQPLEPHGAVPGSPLSTYQSNAVGYGRVSEFYGGINSNAGKTVHTYTMQKDTGLYYTFPYHPPTDNEWLRGLPLKVEHYKKGFGNAYSIVKERENNYLYGNYGPYEVPATIPLIFTPTPLSLELEEDNTNPGTDIISPGLPYEKSDVLFRLPLVHLYYDEGNLLNPLHYKIFHMTGGTVDLKSSVETDYFDDGSSLTKETIYRYNYDHHYRLRSKTTSASNGIKQKTVYDYPPDPSMASEPNVNGLIDKNKIATPLRARSYKDLDGNETIDADELTGSQKTIYGDWGGGLILPEFMETAKGYPESLEPRIQYHDYDHHGNPLDVSKADGTRISYIYGYNHQYPVAKIENKAYGDIPSSLITAIHNTTTESTLTTALNNLRNSSTLEGALITTYTYRPLVGVTSMTDPKGLMTTYHYDSFNRLEFIKDHNGKIVEEYKYHYKNTN